MTPDLVALLCDRGAYRRARERAMLAYRDDGAQYADIAQHFSCSLGEAHKAVRRARENVREETEERPEISDRQRGNG